MLKLHDNGIANYKLFFKIFLWDSDFGFMEIGNLINFIILSCLFYLDYRHYYRITK